MTPLGRRRFLSVAGPIGWVCHSLVPIGRRSYAAESSGANHRDGVELDDGPIDAAIDRGIEFLVRSAAKDGSIADNGHPTAMSSLAIMALAAIGTTVGDDTERSATMRNALRYVLLPANQDREGYFGRKDSSRMYGHGITTLMLTEMLGMAETIQQNAIIHDALDRAIKLILASQQVPKPAKHRGGWRYAPDSRDSDLSVSIWQLMALRSAKNDGLDVPGTAIDAAIEYLINSFETRQRKSSDDGVGGFTYTPKSGNPTFTMTAAGLLAMQVCGRYDSPVVRGSANYLQRNPPKTSERFLFYGLYYYAQGMYQYGGQHSQEATAMTRKILTTLQSDDGSFMARGGQERNIGRVYCTALAILALTVRYHYLPIYQR